MRTTKLLIAACLLAACNAFAQRSSESVTTGSVTNVVRLLSIQPTYSNDSAKVLLNIQETVETFTIIGDTRVNYRVTPRTWTLDAINALPTTWTNQNNGVVNTNNTYRAGMLALWNRLDNAPEQLAKSINFPSMNPPPVPSGP